MKYKFAIGKKLILFSALLVCLITLIAILQNRQSREMREWEREYDEVLSALYPQINESYLLLKDVLLLRESIAQQVYNNYPEDYNYIIGDALCSNSKYMNFRKQLNHQRFDNYWIYHLVLEGPPSRRNEKMAIFHLQRAVMAALNDISDEISLDSLICRDNRVLVKASLAMSDIHAYENEYYTHLDMRLVDSLRDDYYKKQEKNRNSFFKRLFNSD